MSCVSLSFVSFVTVGVIVYDEFELSDKVNKLLDKISLWCTANKLSLSPDKTCYSIFGNYSHIGNIKLFLYDQELDEKEDGE